MAWMMDDLQRSLGRLEGKVDQLLASRIEDATRHFRHEQRLNSLERWRSYIAGAVAIVGVLLAWLTKGGNA